MARANFAISGLFDGTFACLVSTPFRNNCVWDMGMEAFPTIKASLPSSYSPSSPAENPTTTKTLPPKTRAELNYLARDPSLVVAIVLSSSRSSFSDLHENTSPVELPMHIR